MLRRIFLWMVVIATLALVLVVTAGPLQQW